MCGTILYYSTNILYFFVHMSTFFFAKQQLTMKRNGPLFFSSRYVTRVPTFLMPACSCVPFLLIICYVFSYYYIYMNTYSTRSWEQKQKKSYVCLCEEEVICFITPQHTGMFVMRIQRKKKLLWKSIPSFFHIIYLFTFMWLYRKSMSSYIHTRIHTRLLRHENYDTLECMWRAACCCLCS